MSCKIQLKAMISITPPPYLAMFQKAFKNPLITTLESGIEVGPTVINLAFFSRPYGLIRDYIKVI